MAFAITKSPLITAQRGAAGSSQAVGYPLAKNAHGKLRIVQIPYAIVSSTLPAAGDIIELADVKIGGRVLASHSFITCEDPGTTLTLLIGDYSNPKRYAGALVLSAVSSGVGSGFIGFGSVVGVGAEQYVPMDIQANGSTVIRPTPPAWVTGTTYQVGQQILTNSLVYTCLLAHVGGTFATDLTALKWILSGNQQPWVTGTSYTIGDAVYVNGANYICIIAHTASTLFVTDAADWTAHAPDETTVIAQVASISTLTAGKKILINLAVVDE